MPRHRIVISKYLPPGTDIAQLSDKEVEQVFEDVMRSEFEVADAPPHTGPGARPPAGHDR